MKRIDVSFLYSFGISKGGKKGGSPLLLPEELNLLLFYGFLEA